MIFCCGCASSHVPPHRPLYRERPIVLPLSHHTLSLEVEADLALRRWHSGQVSAEAEAEVEVVGGAWCLSFFREPSRHLFPFALKAADGLSNKSTYYALLLQRAATRKQAMNLTLFVYLFAAICIHFVDATATATLGDRASQDQEGMRQFNEKDYVSLMTNYVNDQRYLRGRKLQENIDYQNVYQQQQTYYGASRAQVITLSIVITLTVGLAAYAVFLYREFAAVTLYNVLGYRVFSDSDEQGGSAEQDGVEIS